MVNIAKILENAPIGTKLYSPICGECTLEEVMHDFISVNDVNNKEWDFNSEGTFDANGECLLWPSKERLNWAGWQSLIMRQDECLGTIVMSGMNTPYIITHNGFVLCENINKCLDIVCAPSIDMRFATIEESENAMKMLEEKNGYYWNDEIEELKKVREEPLEAVPTVPEGEIEAVSKDFQSSSEQFEPTKRIDKHNFETELKELLLKYEIDADTNVPAFILSNYIINNLKVLTLMIDKKTRYEADNWI